MEDIRSSAEKYWAPLSAAEPLGDNWGIQKKNQVPVPGRHSLGDDFAHRLVRLICSSRDCGELSIFARQGEWTCASLPDGPGRGCQETSLKKP